MRCIKYDFAYVERVVDFCSIWALYIALLSDHILCNNFIFAIFFYYNYGLCCFQYLCFLAHGFHYKKDERGKLSEYKSVKERLFEATKNGYKKEVGLMLPICNINSQDICGRTIV